MIYAIQVINVIFVLLYLKPTFAAWEYREFMKWGEEYEDCDGKSQSPIKLFIPYMESQNYENPLKFNGYDNIPIKATLKNNGHTLQLDAIWSDCEAPSISGGPLNDEYVFQQLHFHWGPNDYTGSEHILNGKSFPLEQHFVHYKKSYGNFIDALGYEDGLSVIGVFYDLSDAGVQGIDSTLDQVASVLDTNTIIDLEPFALSSFGMISDSQKYATYSGSLTTPPCSEIVTWILPLKPMNVTEQQMERFRSVYFAHFDVENYRVPQPLNGRKVYRFS